MATSLFGRLKTPTVIVNTQKAFTAYGRSFFAIRNVYLSGSPLRNITFFNPFSAVPRLSALYTGFSGIKLQPGTYSTNNDNTVTFTIPAVRREGYIDVIIENEAGYGTLIQHSIKVTANPYLSGSEDYDSFVSYKRPWSSGIKAVSANALGPFVPVNQVYSVGGEYLISIEGDNVVTIE